MPVGQMPVGGANRVWTGPLDRYIRAGLPECVVNAMSGPPPENTGQNKDKGHTSSTRIDIGVEGRESTDYATATDITHT